MDIKQLREIHKKIQERKDTLTSPMDMIYLNNLYELFTQEVWRAIGEREEDL